jgi:hypothetical protein
MTVGHCALHISFHAPASHVLKGEAMPTFRRTCSAPGHISTSTQEKPAIHSAIGNALVSHEISTLTSELIDPGALLDNTTNREEQSPSIFSRSRSCGFETLHIGMEDISSFVLSVQDQDAIISCKRQPHGEVCSNDDRGCACISSNDSLNDSASPNDTSCCISSAGCPSVDIPSHRPMDPLELVTWNLASPNNNPFEFWVRAAAHNFRLMHLRGQPIAYPSESMAGYSSS